MIGLGVKVKDTVTGYVGITTDRTEWLNGCVRLAVQGKVKKDGTVPDPVWFDEGQLEILKSAPVYAPPAVGTGGPMPDPKL